MKIKMLIAMALLVTSSSAQARVYTSSERDKTIELCRTMDKIPTEKSRDAWKLVMDDPDLSNEDKNYILDICYAFTQGQLHQLKK